MSQIILQGLGGLRLIVQGYFEEAASIEVSPTVISTTVNAEVTLTASVPANWSSTCGSLAVAPDGLSAVFTAPATPTNSCSILVEDQADPGNQFTVYVSVFEYLISSFVIAAGVGTLVDSGRAGAYK